MKKNSVERKLKRHFQDQTEYLPTLAIEGVTNNRRAYSARRMQKPLLIALTAYLTISIVVIAWIAVRYTDQVDPAAVTTQEPNENEEPAFEIRRPSAEQDALFKMERVIDTHSTTEFIYLGQDSFDDWITYIDNPICKPTIIRISVLETEIDTSRNNSSFYVYESQAHCRIEEIYYAPNNLNLKVGDTNITIVDYIGLQDDQMWYYEGTYPTFDCYEYYLIGYFSESQEYYTFESNGKMNIIPAADCYEQYVETLNYYSFDIHKSVISDYPRLLQEYIIGFQRLFENSNNLITIKNALAEGDDDLYWQNIVNTERNDLVTTTYAHQIKPGNSIYDIIALLGVPHKLSSQAYSNTLYYYLSEDESQRLRVIYDFTTNIVLIIRHEYSGTLIPDQTMAESVQVGMTYGEVVQIMGAPRYAGWSESGLSSPRMEYQLTDESWVTFYLDYTQDEPVVTSIVFD